MKKSILFIALIAITTMAYPQTSRSRSESNDSPSQRETIKSDPQPSSPSRSSSTAPSTSDRLESRGSYSTTDRTNYQERPSSSPSSTRSREASDNNSPMIRQTPSSDNSANPPSRTYSNPSRNSESRSINNERTNTHAKPSSSPSSTGSREASENNDQSIRRTPSSDNSGNSPSRTNSNQSGNSNVRGTDGRTNTQARPSTTPTTTRSREASKNRTVSRTPSNNNSSNNYSNHERNSREASRSGTVHVVKSPIVVRETRVVHHKHYTYRPIEYRRVHYVYRAPRIINIVWTDRMYHDFVIFYPHHHHYIHLNYERDRRISAISAYDALYHIGEVKKVYGKVSEVYYSSQDDIYYLYIGGPFPYHDFSVVIEGRDYRRNRFPNLFRLEGTHVWSMGLITEFDGKPEILIRKPYQLGVY